MHHVFNGTLPVRPYHLNQFYGTIKADGQLPKVAALACNHQEVIAISLVGYDTSVSAALPGCGSVSSWPLSPIRQSTGMGHSSLVAGRRTTSSFTQRCRARKRCMSWRYLLQRTLPRACSIPPIYRSHSRSKGLLHRLSSRRKSIVHASFWATGMKPHRICAVFGGMYMPCA